MSMRIGMIVFAAALFLQVSTVEAHRKDKAGWRKKAMVAATAATLAVGGAMHAKPATAWTIPPLYCKDGKIGLGFDLSFEVGGKTYVLDWQGATVVKKNGEFQVNLGKSLGSLPKGAKVNWAVGVDGLSVGKTEVSFLGLQASVGNYGLFVKGPKINSKGVAILRATLGHKDAKESPMVFGYQVGVGSEKPVVNATVGARKDGLHASFTVGKDNVTYAERSGLGYSTGVFTKATAPLRDGKKLEAGWFWGDAKIWEHHGIFTPVPIPMVEISNR